jgi:hypothetical protein
MPAQVLPINNICKTLEEDDDQGDMDIIFILSTIIYTVYICSIGWLYPNAKDEVGKFHLIMSHVWGFFPIMQAQGIWLKSLLCMTSYFSVAWHWTYDLELPLPGSSYQKLDALFSVLTIISYCLSWIPKIRPTIPTGGWWNRNFRGNPRQTGEWRLRLTINLLINVSICTIFGVIMFFHIDEFMIMCLCWVFISIAVISALYQGIVGKMKVGKNYRYKFVFAATLGILFGVVSFIHKVKEGNINHTIWHVYVMSCAYCFSRASEYLQL